MGRPLNSKFFGPESDKLGITFNNGSSVVSGFIVKQLGTSSYRVSAPGSDETYDVKLASTLEEASNLQPGFGTIAALDTNGNRVFVTQLTSNHLRTAEGELVSWSATGTVSLVKVGAEVPPTEPEVPPTEPEVPPTEPEVPPTEPELVSPDPTFLGELQGFQVIEGTNELFFGVGNTGDNFVISKNVAKDIELGLKIHKKNSTQFGSFELNSDGIGVYAVPAEEFDISNDVRRVTWMITYAIGSASTNLDDFDISLSLELAPSTDGSVVTLNRQGHNWLLGEQNIISIDGNLEVRAPNVTLVDQNSTNIGYQLYDAFRPAGISENWGAEDGEYNVVLSASKDGVLVAEAKVRVITSTGASW